MSDLLQHGWPGLLLLLLVFGFLPGFVLRLLVLIYPKNDERRKELIAELYALPWHERPLFAMQQLETVLFEGMPLRWTRWSHLTLPRVYRSTFLLKWTLLLMLYRIAVGQEHPKAIRAACRRAMWRGEVGYPASVAAAFESLLPLIVRGWGPDHPETMTIRNQIANCRGQAGDAQGAADYYAELLTHQEMALGPHHPDTLITRCNLTSWRQDIDGAATTLTNYEKLLPLVTDVFGAEHPETLITRNNLANVRGEAGDPVAAAAEFADLLPIRQRILGRAHPHTLDTRDNLTYWREKTPRRDPAGRP